MASDEGAPVDVGTSHERSRSSAATPNPRRAIVVLLIALQILIPAVMLGLRHLDPSRGQMPFSWQMHTSCWGGTRPECDR